MIGAEDDTPPGGKLPLKRGRRPSGEYPGMLCDLHSESLRDQEKRIRSLERAHWRLMGITSGIAGIAAFIGSIIGKYMP